MNGKFKRLVFFRKPNGKLGIRKRYPSAKMREKFFSPKSGDQRCAHILMGSKFGPSTWWFGEPGLEDKTKPNHEVFIMSPNIYLEDN